MSTTAPVPAPAPDAASPATGPAQAATARTPPGLDAVKWVAFIAMLVDHVGGLVLHVPKYSWMYQVGRLSFPLFALVFAWKLAVRHGQGHDTLRRMSRSLPGWALLAQVPFALASGHWLPPNIFVSLWLGCLACRLAVAQPGAMTRAGWLAVVVAAWFVDYALSGVLLIVSVFLAVLPGVVSGGVPGMVPGGVPGEVSGPVPGAARGVHRTGIGPYGLDRAGLVAALASLAMLAVGNGSWWTFAAAPLAAVLLRVRGVPAGPRWGWYVAYPAHLLLIGLWRLHQGDVNWAHWFDLPGCLRDAAWGLPSLVPCWL